MNGALECVDVASPGASDSRGLGCRALREIGFRRPFVLESLKYLGGCPSRDIAPVLPYSRTPVLPFDPIFAGFGFLSGQHCRRRTQTALARYDSARFGTMRYDSVRCGTVRCGWQPSRADEASVGFSNGGQARRYGTLRQRYGRVRFGMPRCVAAHGVARGGAGWALGFRV